MKEPPYIWYMLLVIIVLAIALAGLNFFSTTAAFTAISSKTVDINGDCVVDNKDLSLCAAHFGTNWAQCDLNGDKIVNIYDLVFVSRNVGKVCEWKCINAYYNPYFYTYIYYPILKCSVNNPGSGTYFVIPGLCTKTGNMC